MRLLKGLIIRSMIILVSLLALAPITFAQKLDTTKSGVVKITTTTGQTGTGFIVRVEPEVVYIITAAHVIAGDNQPEVEFFTKRNVPVKGAVLPGAELSDDLRGLALVVVREKAKIPAGVNALPFGTAKDLVSGGEEALVIGQSGGGGNWAVLKRHISNRVGRDISLDPGVASRFSGGPIIVDDKVVGIVMSNRDGFGLGITHKSVLNYIEGFGVAPLTFPIVEEKTPIAEEKIASSIPKPSSPPKEPVPPSSAFPKPSAPAVLLAPPSTAPSKPAIPQTRTGEDGAPMVLVPKGEFTMGSPDGEGETDEHPQHVVHLDDFYIDQYEVTVERYQRVMKEMGHRQPTDWERVDFRRDAQKPAVGIDWHDAQAYCEWVGKRLPTEAEWEKAARGTDKRTYPWGAFKPNSSTANNNKDWSENFYADRLKNVGTYEQGKSPYGVYDMAGNVWEWVEDWYDADYYQASPRKNPQGPPSGDYRALRGGSWFTLPSDLRSANRYWYIPANRNSNFGVRCAQDAP